MKAETTYAIINANGIVENIMVADAAFAKAHAKAAGCKVVLADNTPAWIGGEYVGGAFVAQPEPASAEVPAGAA